MVCPVCEYRCGARDEWCPSCGSYLGLLRRRPRHIAKCVRASIALGLGFFMGLLWQVFLPLTQGRPTGRPGVWFWWETGLGTFLLGLGLRARQHMKEMRRAAARVPQEAAAEAAEDERTPAAAGR